MLCLQQQFLITAFLVLFKSIQISQLRILNIYLMSLIIKPLSAKLLSDSDHFSKMDPYVALELGDQKVKGKAIKNGGKEPKWEEEHLQLKVPIGCSDILKIKVMDKDLLKDDHIGQCQINVSAWTKDYFPKTQQVQLVHKKKPAGSILIQHTYNLAGGQQQPQPGNPGWKPTENKGNQGNQGGGFLI